MVFFPRAFIDRVLPPYLICSFFRMIHIGAAGDSDRKYSILKSPEIFFRSAFDSAVKPFYDYCWICYSSVPDPYYLDKKVKLVELFSYHKLGLTNKYTHLFGDS